jgi:hypothetical protein
MLVQWAEWRCGARSRNGSCNSPTSLTGGDFRGLHAAGGLALIEYYREVSISGGEDSMRRE